MNILTAFIDLIFPPVCLLCGEFLWDEPVIVSNRRIDFCKSCYSSFKRITGPVCPSCGRPYPEDSGSDHLCEDCISSPPAYDMITAPFIFEGPLMDAVHAFKYGRKLHYAKSLGPILSQYVSENIYLAQPPVVMPIPLHPKRLRERGFNQSLLLARFLSKEIGGDLDFLSLRRTRFTPPQTMLNREQRLKNLKGAFELTLPGQVAGRIVLLVDDVATTGTTFNECARVLKKAGAIEVLAIALARAV
ncbi:MAG: ComF family protein [Deltaproteobacteria bacterium]|nr:MAG: ComF family protein [Deltaproteobacteria bacterium]